MLLLVSLTVFCTTGAAQDSHRRMTREQLAKVQARHIADELEMDDVTSLVAVLMDGLYDKWCAGDRVLLLHDGQSVLAEAQESPPIMMAGTSSKGAAGIPVVTIAVVRSLMLSGMEHGVMPMSVSGW